MNDELRPGGAAAPPPFTAPTGPPAPAEPPAAPDEPEPAPLAEPVGPSLIERVEGIEETLLGVGATLKSLDEAVTALRETPPSGVTQEQLDAAVDGVTRKLDAAKADIGRAVGRVF